MTKCAHAPTPPEALQDEIPEHVICTFNPRDHHEIDIHKDGSWFFRGPDGQFICDVHEMHRRGSEMARLEAELAAARSERDRAQDDATDLGRLLSAARSESTQLREAGYKAGIEAAHKACERVFLDYESETDWDRGYSLAVAFCRNGVRELLAPVPGSSPTSVPAGSDG